MSHLFLIPTLKEFKKSTNICQSYSKNKSGPFFDSQCILWCSYAIAYNVYDVTVSRTLIFALVIIQRFNYVFLRESFSADSRPADDPIEL